jgi:N-acetylglucosamine-6-sulfatase
MVLSIDVAPTLLQLAGLEPAASVQGRSLVPVFENASRDWRTSFLVEYFSDTVFPRIRNMGYVAVRTTRHKYVRYQELQDMNELYDLEADPYERHNLAGVPEARPVLERMEKELGRLLAETKSPPARQAAR